MGWRCRGTGPPARPPALLACLERLHLAALRSVLACKPASSATTWPHTFLLPSLLQPRTNDELKVDYFEYFLKLKPSGTIDESFVRCLDPECDVGINSGIYTFDVEKNGKPQKVGACGGGWVGGRAGGPAGWLEGCAAALVLVLGMCPLQQSTVTAAAKELAGRRCSTLPAAGREAQEGCARRHS